MQVFFYYSPVMVTILTSLSVITNISKTVLNQYHRHQYLQALAQEMSVHPAIGIHLKLWAEAMG